MLAVGLAMLGVLLMSTRKREPLPKVGARRAEMIALVRAEALRQGVDPVLALATAETESNFNPEVPGDVQWPYKRGGELYQKHVLENPAFDSNPARLEAKAWHSYGLFQLLAPYHLQPTEHPDVLWDPKLNAERGIAYLKALWRKHKDVWKVRLAYAGALQASEAEKQRVLGRFTENYEAWRKREAGDLA